MDEVKLEIKVRNFEEARRLSREIEKHLNEAIDLMVRLTELELNAYAVISTEAEGE